MYVKTSTDTERSYAVELVLEDIPGGGTIDPADFPSTSTSLLEGALVGKDSSGLYHLVKTAEVHADVAVDATSIQVKKGHEFKVGDFVTDTGKTLAAEAITAIDTSNEAYDALTINAAIGALSDGDLIVLANAQAAAGSAAFKYTPVAVTRNSVDLTNDNLGSGLVNRGRVREALMPYKVDTALKALLPLINFV